MDISYQEAPRKCGLNAHQHLKLNSAVNLILWVLFLTSLCMKSWFYYKDSDYSLRGVKNSRTNDWQDFSDFKSLCIEYNIERYSDLKASCEEYQSFEMAGIIYIVAATISLLMQLYCVLSSASSAWNVDIWFMKIDVLIK